MRCNVFLAVTDCGVRSELPAIPLDELLDGLADLADLAGDCELRDCLRGSADAFPVGLLVVGVGDAVGY